MPHQRMSEGKRREQARIATRKYHAKQTPEWYKRRRVKTWYGLSLEDYEEILLDPCRVCGEEDKPRVLDHCHETGVVRGALCYGCNSKVDWYLRHKEDLKLWEELVFGTIWISRELYEGLIRRSLMGDIAGDRITDLKAQLNDLKDELQLQKARVDREQMRADSALHTMTAQKTGIEVAIPMVKPSVDEDADPHEEVPNIVEELRVDIRERGAMTILEESRPKH